MEATACLDSHANGVGGAGELPGPHLSPDLRLHRQPLCRLSADTGSPALRLFYGPLAATPGVLQEVTDIPSKDLYLLCVLSTVCLTLALACPAGVNSLIL